MSTEQQPSRPGRGGGAAPVGSTVAIVVAVIAVVLGFVILRDLNDDDGGDAISGPGTEETTGDTIDLSSTTVTSAPAETTTTLTVDGAKVVVANASGAQGTAGKWTTALQTRGFTVGTATNATGAESRLDVTKVYVVANSEAVAQSVAAVLGGVEVAPMPDPAPAEALGDATVLVMLGKDIATKTLAEVEPGGTATAPTTTTTTVAGSAATS